MPPNGHPDPTVQTATDRLLTAAEVADRLRVEPITVVRLCREHKIPATKPAGTWLISEADLKAHIEASRNQWSAA
jgi:excisionase family DNA binding protein